MVVIACYPCQNELLHTVYTNLYATVIGTVGRALLYLPFLVVGIIVSLWLETTVERLYRLENGPCYERFVLLALGTPVLFFLLVLSFVPALIGTLCYVSVLGFRKNVQLYICDKVSICEPKLDNKTEILSEVNLVKKEVAFLTANSCLLPSFLAKFNNLNDTKSRAVAIGHRLADQKPIINSTLAEVIESIPDDVDFLCLQEIFERSAALALVNNLKGIYPHIIWGADSNNFFKILNSGLFFASKYKILDFEFKGFEQSGGADSFADKGLLCVLVDMSEFFDLTSNAMSTAPPAGFIFAAHLQAQEGSKKERLRSKQLNSMAQWITAYKSHHCAKNNIMLDVLCGDFNRVWNADGNALYTEYVDVCPQDENWQNCNIPPGTEMRQSFIHSDEICNSENMKSLLISCQSHDYGSCSNMTNLFFGDNGRKRIDHILLHKSLVGNYPGKSMHIKKYAFVTALAGLTDHLSVYARMSLNKCIPSIETSNA